MSSKGLAKKILTGIAGSALVFLTSCETPTQQQRGLGYFLMGAGAPSLGRAVVDSANAEEYRNNVNVNVNPGGNSSANAQGKLPYPDLRVPHVFNDWIDRNGNGSIDSNELWMDHNDNDLIDGDDEFRGEKWNFTRGKSLGIIMHLIDPRDKGYWGGVIEWEIVKRETSQVVFKGARVKITYGESQLQRERFYNFNDPGMYTWTARLIKPEHPPVNGRVLGRGTFIIK